MQKRIKKIIPQTRKKVIIDQGRKLKVSRARKISFSKSFNKSFIQKCILIIILTFLISISGVWFFRNKTYNQALKAGIVALNVKCERLAANAFQTIFLEVNYENNALKTLNLVVLNNGLTSVIDYKNAEIAVDKNGMRGSFQKYFDLNTVYIAQNTIIANLPNLFLREFNIKIDFVIVERNNFTFESYMKNISSSVFSKVLNKKRPEVSLHTSLCLDDWDKFIALNLQNNKRTNNYTYSPNKKFEDFLRLEPIKLEQLRVQITNKSGVDSWGVFYGNILKNYGVTVVKVDTVKEIVPKTTLYVDSEASIKSNTFSQLSYILNKVEFVSKIKSSTYSDINLELGVDSIDLRN